MSDGPSAAAPLRLVLLRHGQTSWNAEGRFQGQHDTPLTDLGRAQAGVVAQELARAAAGTQVRVVASDLQRAQHTATAVATALDVPVRLDPRLREIHAGTWQGLLRPQIEASDPVTFAQWRAGDDVALGGAERPSESGERVRAAAAQHAADQDGGGVLVLVGHGASLRAGLAALLAQPGLRRVLAPLDNTAAAVLLTDPGPRVWSLHGWNLPPTAIGHALGAPGPAEPGGAGAPS